VIDPANLPAVPVAPKRWTLSALGLALGLALGVFLAGLFEVPRLFTIQTIEDAAHYTRLPVLIAVPELLSPQEVKTRPLRRKMLLAMGIAVTLISIPAFVLALKAIHISTASFPKAGIGWLSPRLSALPKLEVQKSVRRILRIT